MTVTISPLAPQSYAQMPSLDGVRIATAAAGIKYEGRKDLLLMEFDEQTSVAGVFTQSLCASAPVELCRINLPGGRARALVVNSGNANAFTGRKGSEAAEITARVAAEAIGCSLDEVFLASTGVIGEPLDAKSFSGTLKTLADKTSADGWSKAAEAIMTTDTYPKLATRSVAIDDIEVRINGIAKGAGMIAPDMATMLSFLVTDAAIAPDVLQGMVSRAVNGSFNAITIDSDTSTSDTVLLFATGKRLADAPIVAASDPRLALLQPTLDDLSLELAHAIVKDGEGLTKFITVEVTGATSDASADVIARSIGNSPLVKTAFAGEDANWGRVVMAVGKAGEPADRDRLSIWFGADGIDVRVAFMGERDPDYSEDAAARVMKRPEITLRVDLGLGEGRAVIWTCDLTKAYIAINGDYRS